MAPFVHDNVPCHVVRAEEGVILPREPLILVDKQWRIGKGATGKPSKGLPPQEQSNFKVRVLGNPAVIDHGKNVHQSPPGKQRKYHFVQSRQSVEAANAEISQRSRRTTRVAVVKTPLSPKRSISLNRRDTIKVDSTPAGSSLAFYGNIDENLDIRYTELLKYYVISIADSFYPLRSKVVFDTNPIGTVWLPLALGDEALLNTAMLASAEQIARFNPAAYGEILQRLSRSAITLVNQRIQSKILTDATLGAVSCMVLIEHNMGRPKQSEIHHTGLLELIRQRGGINSINLSLQMKIYRAALLPTVDNLQRPRLPRIRPSRPSLHTTLGLERLSEEHYTARLAQSGLDLELIDILLTMRQLSQAVEYAMKHAHDINQQAFDEDTMNIFHDLASRPRDEKITSLNESSQFAALIYMNTLTRASPFRPVCSGKLAHALMTELERLNRDYTVDSVVLWVVFIGSLASSNTAEKPQFRRLLSEITKSLRVTEWKACQSRLQSICWIDKIHDEDGLVVWNDIQNL